MGANFELRTGQVLQEKIVGTDNYRERYKIGQKVGSGSFGVTHKVLLALLMAQWVDTEAEKSRTERMFTH